MCCGVFAGAQMSVLLQILRQETELRLPHPSGARSGWWNKLSQVWKDRLMEPYFILSTQESLPGQKCQGQGPQRKIVV